VWAAGGENRTRAIDCDGGALDIQACRDDRVLRKPRNDPVCAECDAGDAVLRKTPDDTSFLLSPLPRSHCKAE